MAAVYISTSNSVLITDPYVIFYQLVPKSLAWSNTAQSSYFIVNSTTKSIPLASGTFYYDGNSVLQTSIPAGVSLSITINSINNWIQNVGALQAAATPAEAQYQLPIANTNTLGGVKIGQNILISPDGTISTNPSTGPIGPQGPTGPIGPSGASITLTTTGTTGSATLISGILNIPNYGGSVTLVTSFNTRTGAITLTGSDVTTALTFTPYNATNPSGYISSVPAQSFSSLTGKPTTLGGYGITDAYPLSGNPSGFLTSVPAQSFASLTSKPTTLSGYGITDAYPLSGNPSGFLTTIAAQSFASLTGKPTTLSGYGITDAYPLSGNPSAFLTTITGSQVTTALGYTPYNSTNPNSYITSSGAPVQTVNGQSGTVVLAKSDVGLSNVDNTSDVNKPVSTATQTALNGKQNSLTIIQGTAAMVFPSVGEDSTTVTTISNALITNAGLKSFTIIPLATSADHDSLDDFSWDQLDFNIENIIDNTSFDIRAIANNMTFGTYNINYSILA